MTQKISYDFSSGMIGLFIDATKFKTKAGNDNDLFSIADKQAIRNAVFAHLREGKLTHVGTRPGAKFLMQGWHERSPGNPIFTIFKCTEAGKDFFKASVFNQLELTPYQTIEQVAEAIKTHLSIALPLPKPELSLVSQLT